MHVVGRYFDGIRYHDPLMFYIEPLGVISACSSKGYEKIVKMFPYRPRVIGIHSILVGRNEEGQLYCAGKHKAEKFVGKLKKFCDLPVNTYMLYFREERPDFSDLRTGKLKGKLEDYMPPIWLYNGGRLP